MRGPAFAVDIGGTNTVVAFVSDAGHVKVLQRFPTDYRSASATVARIGHTLQEAGLSEPGIRLGVGAPNACSERGTVEQPPNLDWDEVTPLASMLKQCTGMETKLINDADAAAIGEGHFGAARGLSDYIVVTLGTGFGSGIVCNGELIRGARGTAGDLGHFVMNKDGLLCGCGRRGCLETLIAARVLTSTSEATYQKLAEPLGLALANAVTLFGPEKIILTGGLTRAGARLLDPTRRVFEQSLRAIDRGKVPLMISNLPEGNAALLGAACIAI